MASDAFDELERKEAAAREAEAAAYIMRDVELRQQNVEENGVLAYGKRPIPRGRPNERFLQNTLKSVDFANRKAREDEMWAKWTNKQGARGSMRHEPTREVSNRHTGMRGWSTSSQRKTKSEATAGARSHESGSSQSSASASSEGDAAEQNTDLEQLLSSRAIRGRGASGPRADETGPFLFPTDEQERQEYEMLRYAEAKKAGPDCPDWIRANNTNNTKGDQNSRSAVEPAAIAVARPPSGKKKWKKEAKERKKAKKMKKEKKRKRKRSPSLP